MSILSTTQHGHIAVHHSRNSAENASKQRAAIYARKAAVLNKGKDKYTKIAVPKGSLSAVFAVVALYYKMAAEQLKSRALESIDETSKALTRRDGTNNQTLVNFAVAKEYKAARAAMKLANDAARLHEMLANAVEFSHISKIFYFVDSAMQEAMTSDC